METKSNKRVLITGGAGFIAHHVIYYLLKNTNWNIISLDRLDTSSDINRIHEIIKDFDKDTQKRVKILFHDLRAEINSQIKEKIGHVDIILHMAASSHVTRSIKYPIEFVENNVMGTTHLLEYARSLNNLERFLYFSTDEVFGPSIPGVKFKEYDRYNGANPYSASKAAAEEICVAYSNTYKMPIYITHTMNVFGERQANEKFIPMAIEKIKKDEIITVHINKKTNQIGSRHYLHALDVADAILFILNLKKVPFPLNHTACNCPKFNIEGTLEVNNLEIAQMIANVLGKPLKYELIEPLDRPGHDFNYSISGDYLRSLGWKPKIEFKDGLAQVVKWHMDN